MPLDDDGLLPTAEVAEIRGWLTELGAGDMAVFPKGWSGTWDIHETVRKVYAIF